MYLRQLVRYRLSSDAERTVRLLISRELLERTERELTAGERALLRERTSLIEEHAVYIRLVRWVRATSIVDKLFVEYLIATQPPDCEVVLLYLDAFIFQLAILPLPRKCVSGILFRTSFHHRDVGIRIEGAREYLLFLAKYATCRLCAVRTGIHRIFVQDPFAQAYAEKTWRTTKYITVPDPVGPEAGAPPPVVASLPPSGRRRVLLVCGELSRRKGVLVVLRALATLEPCHLSRIQVRFVGPILHTERGSLLAELARFQHSQPAAEISLDERFYSGAEFDAAILAADVVLTLYERSFGSSATVIRAAMFGRPVISTDQGLLGRLVRRHRAGVAVDVRDSRAVAQVFRKFVDTGVIEEFDPQSAWQYARSCSPPLFAQRILPPVAGDRTCDMVCP
jgi:glycosyltransferase involved in cell wall biosynthesis